MRSLLVIACALAALSAATAGCGSDGSEGGDTGLTTVCEGLVGFENALNDLSEGNPANANLEDLQAARDNLGAQIDQAEQDGTLTQDQLDQLRSAFDDMTTAIADFTAGKTSEAAEAAQSSLSTIQDDLGCTT